VREPGIRNRSGAPASRNATEAVCSLDNAQALVTDPPTSMDALGPYRGPDHLDRLSLPKL